MGFGASGDGHPTRAEGGCELGRIESVEGLGAAASAWEALASRDPYAHVFQSHAWLRTWLHYHPGTQPDILLARRGDRLTAALPLCVRRLGCGPLSLRVLRFAADNDSDYCDALSDPDYPHDLDLVWAALRERGDWHLLDLRYVPEKAHLARLLGTRDGGILVDRRQQDIAPYLDLSDDWRRSLPKGQRDSILRRARRLRERGVVSFDVAGCHASIDEMLLQLAKIHVARWQARGQTSMFCFQHYREWLQALCRQFLESGQLYLCRLTLDGDPVSVGLYFLDGRRILGYISTFAAEYMEYGPGHLLEAMVVDDVRARGLADLDDFGRGGEEYKLRWSTGVRALDRFLVARRTPVGVSAFGWAARVQPLLWRHHRLGTIAREVRRRAALRRPS